MAIIDTLKKLKLNEHEYELYCNKFAKLDISYKSTTSKLIVVTSINPTPAGEGKTTLLIGLVDAMNAHHLKTLGTLRQPSLGPVFGVKGTATGGGESALLDSDDINLHFTGDFHALTAANNLISTMIENEVYYQSKLNIDPQTIMWKRCLDLNDRGLREITVKIDKQHSYQTGFNITAASDLMALFCLVNNQAEFKSQLANTIVAYTTNHQPITIHDLQIEDAVMAILKNAFKPNLALTTNQNPILIHGGPFANIAHGCNSIIATKTALSLADYVVTECGFGADLGLEKFMNIKMQRANLYPSLIVICVTIKALKYHGQQTDANDLQQLVNGFENLKVHVAHVRAYHLEPLIILNVNQQDTSAEIETFEQTCKQLKFAYEISHMYHTGTAHTKSLVEHIQRALQTPVSHFLYDLKHDSAQQKIAKIVNTAYHLHNITYANPQLEAKLQDQAYKDYYVCLAKTQYSLSSDPSVLNCPSDGKIEITDLEINHAAKLLIPICGKIWKMPGLPLTPRAKNYK